MSISTAQIVVRNTAQLPVGELPLAGKRSLLDLTTEQNRSLEVALKHIFPERREETRLQKVRRIMGDDVSCYTDAELEVHLSEFQFLLDCWIDEFEKKLFNNLTLKQLLGEV